MRLGDLEITLVNDGEFRLDGGAMFGVVPRTMWERVKPPDGRNRIRMATNCLLVERGRDLLLIDSGIGDKNDARFQDMFGMDPAAVRLPEAIRRAGYSVEQVTHVLLTHLHFDHCGWNTRAAGSAGELVPTFPHATYWLERGEVEHARHANERDRASYDPRNWEPLFAAGVVRLFDGGGEGAEPIPGVRAVRVPGHNANMCVVTLDGRPAAPERNERGETGAAAGAPEGPAGLGAVAASGAAASGAAVRAVAELPYGGRAVFFADLVPTRAHVAYPWIMSYDLFPLTTLENKKIWLPRVAALGWLAIFQHEAEEPLGTLEEEKPGRFRSVPVGPVATTAAAATAAAG